MDSDSPLAFGIAGQACSDTGTSFTGIAGASKSEFTSISGFGRNRTVGERRGPGSHPRHRPADGDGR